MQGIEGRRKERRDRMKGGREGGRGSVGKVDGGERKGRRGF